MQITKISWCTHTCNPVYTIRLDNGKRGWICSKVGEDCRLCYAETLNMRYGNKLKFNHASIQKIRWMLNRNEFTQIRKAPPAIIFLGDMYDTFHENMPVDFIREIFKVMCECDWHIFMILTKRPHIMKRFVDEWVKENGVLPEHIWLGTSIGLKKYWARVNWLKKVNCHIRFLSVEPQLGSMGRMSLTGIDMMIVGGESGDGHRLFKKEWGLQDLRECRRQNVSFFFKQDGDRFPGRRENLLGKIYHEYPIDLDLWREKARKKFEMVQCHGSVTTPTHYCGDAEANCKCEHKHTEQYSSPEDGAITVSCLCCNGILRDD